MSSFREVPPGPQLGARGVVACTWTLTTARSAGVQELRILPDGGLDLIWSGSELLVAAPDRVARTLGCGQATTSAWGAA